jgi:L-alanine-DL-glutamate epimerase-like enolase superfamily enzyme
MIRLISSSCEYTVEQLKAPFGFKGGKSNYIWTISVCLKSENATAYGTSIQGILWSDAGIYRDYGEEKGNELMFSLTDFAVKYLQGKEYDKPEDIFPELERMTLGRAVELTGRKPRKTFILNALVPVDNALRFLYCRENGKEDFISFAGDHDFFQCRHDRIAAIPLITYNTSEKEIKDLADNGTCIFKIKIGSDPDHDNDRDKMLAQDKKRILEIHSILKGYKTGYTNCGRIVYYLDANGRYDTIERISELLDDTKKTGAYDRIILLEEPFDETNLCDVSTLPVTVAADESIHDIDDAVLRIQLGYKAFALKPIAKTVTRTVEIADIAYEHGIACFCADLTVTPMLVELNKNFAARLNVIPGMKTGILETNGAQNYMNWDTMLRKHPLYGERFTVPQNGIFNLDDMFYKTDGGIFIGGK